MRPAMQNAEVILGSIREWLEERKGIAVEPSMAYVEAAELDSFDIMELVVFAEDRFGFRFSDADFRDPSFGTLEGLAALIHAKGPGRP